MNFLRSFQTKDHFQTEIVADQDSPSNYFDKHELQEYEESARKAAEMELILGKALAVHQRDTGSIHKMERYGEHSAIEVGKRIASMHSRDEMSAANARLGRANSFDSGTSSTASLPTFVRVQSGDSVLKPQNSWDEELKKYDSDDQSLSNLPPGRDWSKLRREFDEQSRFTHEKGDLVFGKRSRSIGKRALGFGKKILGDSSNRPASTYKIKARSKSNRSVQKGYAMDYDVEVALNEKKHFWEGRPSILKAALARKETSGTKQKAKETPQKDQEDASVAERGTRITVVEGYYVADDEDPVETQEKHGTELHQIFGGACSPALCTKK